MIKTSQAFREAIVGSPRAIELLAVVDISDPDKALNPPIASPEAPWSRKDQLQNYDVTSPRRYATGERGRWLGDGSFDLFPDNYVVPSEVGYAGRLLSGSSGAFSEDQWVHVNFTGVRILQACSLFFDTDKADGVPYNFTVEIWSGAQKYLDETVTGNTEAEVQFRGFTVYDPTSVRITVHKWSLPSRRMRMVEFVIGFFERWTGDDLASFSATLQGQFSCLSLPYGSVTLAMDNADRRFEPRRKDSLFQSIEERQGVDIYIGCQTSEGLERIKIGVFYQAGDGWKTSSNELTMQWYLVDIIGLISDRTFVLPRDGTTDLPLPTTLAGWLKALVSQLGPAFENRYKVDPAYANKAVTVINREDVAGKKCGDILRWACQVTGTWPRADQSTGALCAEPLWNEGNKYTLDNLNKYPTMKANESLAALIFQLAVEGKADKDGNTPTEQQEFVVSGNSTTSEKTVTIINPFLHTTDQALSAARLILAQYGGNQLELTGRGDPSSEIGDVDTVWLDESTATTARRMSQTFQFQDGVMQSCRSTLLQADGSYLWTEFVVIRESGIFKAPPGVHQLRIVLGRGGQGGGRGQDGQYKSAGSSNIFFTGYNCEYGEEGVPGQGGEIWYGVIDCNEGQEFAVHLGAGGAPGAEYGQAGALGEHTTFGVYSSANGQLYANGYTDIANGQVFARTGVGNPLSGTGDGGKGGAGGDPPEGYLRTYTYTPTGAAPTVVNTRTEWRETKPPGPGHPGVQGATGFAMITWDRPDAASRMRMRNG